MRLKIKRHSVDLDYCNFGLFQTVVVSRESAVIMFSLKCQKRHARSLEGPGFLATGVHSFILGPNHIL